MMEMNLEGCISSFTLLLTGVECRNIRYNKDALAGHTRSCIPPMLDILFVAGREVLVNTWT
jgi:hypothetical protein